MVSLHKIRSYLKTCHLYTAKRPALQMVGLVHRLFEDLRWNDSMSTLAEEDTKIILTRFRSDTLQQLTFRRSG
jgi:hypothetical protein